MVGREYDVLCPVCGARYRVAATDLGDAVSVGCASCGARRLVPVGGDDGAAALGAP